MMTPKPGLCWNALMRFCLLAVWVDETRIPIDDVRTNVKDFFYVVLQQPLDVTELAEDNALLFACLDHIKPLQKPVKLGRLCAILVKRLRLEDSKS